MGSLRIRGQIARAAADLSFWGLGIITLGLELIGNDEINYFEKE